MHANRTIGNPYCERCGKPLFYIGGEEGKDIACQCSAAGNYHLNEHLEKLRKAHDELPFKKKIQDLEAELAEERARMHDAHQENQSFMSWLCDQKLLLGNPSVLLDTFRNQAKEEQARKKVEQ